MKRSSLGMFVGAATIAAINFIGTVPASATLVYVTYEGIVDETRDLTGLFGGGSFANARYTANYVFDVVFGLNNQYTNTATKKAITGGSAFSTVSPLVSASITIGTTTVSINGDYFSVIEADNSGGSKGLTSQYHIAQVQDFTSGDLYNSIVNYKGNAGLPAELILADFFYLVTAGDTAAGAFCGNGSCIGLIPTSLHITTTPLSETPIPAALPLFATGLGALGVMAYRRKRKRG